jgi:hypothetical protein
MSRRIIFFFLLCLAVPFFAGNDASAAAFTMGQLQTVGSDGSLDVVRSPSLIAVQKTEHSIGMMFLYTPYALHRYYYDYYKGNWAYTTRVRERKNQSGGAVLAYCRKVTKGAVGVAVDTDAGSQVSYHGFEETYAGFITGNNNYAVKSGSVLNVSPRAVFSYGREISGNHSIGVQCAAGYSVFKEDLNFNSIMLMAADRKHHAKKKIDEVAVQASFGYTYRDGDSQAGLLVRSGRFAWQKTKIHYVHQDFMTPVFYAGSVSEPNHLVYDPGLTLAAGGYQKLTSFIAVALEGEYEIPVSYNMKDLRYDDMTDFFGVTLNLGVKRSGRYSVRTGFEILPAGPVTISLGGGINAEREKRKGRFISETINRESYTGVFGIDIRAVNNMLIMAGTRLAYIHERGKSAVSNGYTDPSTYNGPVKLLDISVFSGLSYGF